MPEPLYQRELGCAALSTFTASIFFSLPYFRYGVSSYRKLMYPLGRLPRCCPLIHTSLFIYTPSKSINTFLFLADAGNTNVLRYHPVPPRNAPPPVPVGLSLSNGNSMLQSCGSESERQVASLKAGCSAPLPILRPEGTPLTSLKINFQLSL